MASRAISQALRDSGESPEWQKPLEELVAREADFNPAADNPKSSAHGLFQFLDMTRDNYGGKKVDWSNPYQQAVAGIKYIKDRYGDPYDALEFWDENKSY